MIVLYSLLGDDPIFVEEDADSVMKKVMGYLTQTEVDALSLLIKNVDKYDPEAVGLALPETYRAALVGLVKRVGEEAPSPAELPLVVLGPAFTRALLERAGVQVVDVPEYFITYGNIEEVEDE